MDRYALAVNSTVMENAAFFGLEMNEDLVEERLLQALSKALLYHPLFKTHVVYDGGYYLESNEKPLIVTHAKESDRPKDFGTSTNGYPWRLSSFGNALSFEWCHVISDGHGALAFLGDVLAAYFGVSFPELPKEFPLTLTFEHFADPTVKAMGQIKQQPGLYPEP